MSGRRDSPRWLPPPAWTFLIVAAALIGAYLRLDQFASQVLIDDEWHAVHQMLRRGPAAMFIDFGFSDYSIPLGIFDWYVSRWFGLSETAMRAPMLLCGLATLLLFPLYVARYFSYPAAAVFALLVAMSPLLVVYSRMARPYAITLLLGWVAHAAYQRYHAASRARIGAGIAFGATATLAVWLHPIAAPFVLAPLLWALLQLRRAGPGEWRARSVRLLQVALPTGVAMAALVLPPLLANPLSMTLKTGVDSLAVGTLAGVWFAWLGTPSSVAVVVCLALAAIGAPEVWRKLPEARTATLGIVLTLLAVGATRPMWSFMPLTVARYLLPFLPLLLLAVAAGAVRCAQRLATPPSVPRRAFGAVVALLPCIALAWQSPLPPLLRDPNAQTLHLTYHFDFRPAANPYLTQMESIPLSPFWAKLEALPPGSVRVAAAPFYFESYDWDAPRWERLSGQTVLPGYVTGLCVDRRFGEVPADPLFRFRNAVHLADGRNLAQRGIDYVVWQKPYLQPRDGEPIPIGGETAYCEDLLRRLFGPPAFEDAALIAFRIAPVRTSPDAAR